MGKDLRRNALLANFRSSIETLEFLVVYYHNLTLSATPIDGREPDNFQPRAQNVRNV